MVDAAAPLSLRAFARILGCSDYAVRKAVASGRLSASVTRGADGHAEIADVALAQQEWAQNATKRTKGNTPVVLAEAQRRVAMERARSLRLSNNVKQGKLIDANKAARDSFDAARVIREAILNIPDRLSAELAAETDPHRVFARLDAELRQALDAAATALVS